MRKNVPIKFYLLFVGTRLSKQSKQDHFCRVIEVYTERTVVASQTILINDENLNEFPID